MQFLDAIGYEVVLVIHILASVVAVGTVTVTDYLHIVGLRDKRIEKKLLFVYKLLGHMIHGAILLIFLSGAALLVHKPELMQSALFQTKMLLFAIAVVNGIYLNRIIFPEMDACVREGGAHCSLDILFTSSLCGSISVVTWYAILILALTKEFAYPVSFIWSAYAIAIAVAFSVALFLEHRARKWG